MYPGIYITLTSGEQKKVSFKNLGEWKQFASDYFVEDIDRINIKCYSLNNSQKIDIEITGDELVGFEACYKAVRMSYGFYQHYVVIYIPGRNPDYYLMINENARLLSTPKIQNTRKKLFYFTVT